MGVVGGEAQHAPQPEPRPEPVGEIRHGLVAAAGRVRAVEPLLAGVERLRFGDGKADQVEAVAGVEPVLADGGELLAEQRQQGFGRARRATGAEREMLHGAIDPEEARRDAARALAPARQRGAEVPAQRQERGLDLGDLGEAAGVAPFRHAARGLEARPDGGPGEPHQPVEPLKDLGAEPGRDGAARPGQEVADPHEAGPGEARHRVGVEPQRRDRQGGGERAEAGLERGRGQRLGAEPRQGPGGFGCRGHGGAGRQALAAQPGDDCFDEPRFTPEQVRGPADVEHRPVAPVGRRERREPAAPVHHGIPQRRIGIGIRLGDAHGGAQGARVGQGEAGPQAPRRPEGIDSHHALRPPDLGDRDQRLIRHGSGRR